MQHWGDHTGRVTDLPTCCQRGSPKPSQPPECLPQLQSWVLFKGRDRFRLKHPQFAIFAATQPHAQGHSCPKAALVAGVGTSGTSSQGTRGILEAESSWGRENIPVHTPALAGSSRRGPCSVGTPRHRQLPRDPAPDPAPQTPGSSRLRGGCRTQPCIPTAAALLTLCLFFNCVLHFNAILLV